MRTGLWVALTVVVHVATARAGVRYNEVYQHSSHNAYEVSKPSLTSQLDAHIQSLELDMHIGKGPRRRAAPGDWFVYHIIGARQKTSCATLSDCLGEIARWHDGHARHEVITIFLDLKHGWGSGHGPAELDALLARLLGSALVEPAELALPCRGPLRSALARCGWPELAALRGKVLVVLMGESGHLDAYTRSGSRAFIAPEITSREGVAAHPDAVFFNLNSDHFALGGEVFRAGYVSRVYYRNTRIDVHGVNDANHWKIAAANSIHHIATDEVGAPWANTANAHGWPFTCLLTDCSDIRPAETSPARGPLRAARHRPPDVRSRPSRRRAAPSAGAART